MDDVKQEDWKHRYEIRQAAWKAGYRDGIRYHIDGIVDAKARDRYLNDEDYCDGFDAAGEDS